MASYIEHLIHLIVITVKYRRKLWDLWANASRTALNGSVEPSVRRLPIGPTAYGDT